jgi:hypothetical protein
MTVIDLAEAIRLPAERDEGHEKVRNARGGWLSFFKHLNRPFTVT